MGEGNYKKKFLRKNSLKIISLLSNHGLMDVL